MFEVKKSPFHLLETKFPQTALLGRGCLVLSLEDEVVGWNPLARDDGYENKGVHLSYALKSSLADSLTDSRPSTPRFCLFQMAH